MHWSIKGSHWVITKSLPSDNSVVKIGVTIVSDWWQLLLVTRCKYVFQMLLACKETGLIWYIEK